MGTDLRALAKTIKFKKKLRARTSTKSTWREFFAEWPPREVGCNVRLRDACYYIFEDNVVDIVMSFIYRVCVLKKSVRVLLPLGV